MGGQVAFFKGPGASLREAVFEQRLTGGNRESHVAAGRAFWTEGRVSANALSQECASVSEEPWEAGVVVKSGQLR